MPPLPRTWVEDKSIDILVESYSNAARTIQIRGISDAEQISHDHPTNSDRSIASSTININSIPRYLTAKCAATGVQRGACYVKVSLRAEGNKIATLMQGYITDAASVFFPGGENTSPIEGPGLIRSITGTDPAAGAEISETVPTGARWRLLSLTASFIASATAANRIARLAITDGTSILCYLQSGTAITANQNTNNTWSANGIRNTGSPNSYEGDGISEYRLPAGYKITTATQNIDTGDNWGAPQMLVEEWIQP